MDGRKLSTDDQAPAHHARQGPHTLLLRGILCDASEGTMVNALIHVEVTEVLSDPQSSQTRSSRPPPKYIRRSVISMERSAASICRLLPTGLGQSVPASDSRHRNGIWKRVCLTVAPFVLPSPLPFSGPPCTIPGPSIMADIDLEEIAVQR